MSMTSSVGGVWVHIHVLYNVLTFPHFRCHRILIGTSSHSAWLRVQLFTLDVGRQAGAGDGFLVLVTADTSDAMQVRYVLHRAPYLLRRLFVGDARRWRTIWLEVDGAAGFRDESWPFVEVASGWLPVRWLAGWREEVDYDLAASERPCVGALHHALIGESVAHGCHSI